MREIRDVTGILTLRPLYRPECDQDPRFDSALNVPFPALKLHLFKRGGAFWLTGYPTLSYQIQRMYFGHRPLILRSSKTHSEYLYHPYRRYGVMRADE